MRMHKVAIPAQYTFVHSNMLRMRTYGSKHCIGISICSQVLWRAHDHVESTLCLLGSAKSAECPSQIAGIWKRTCVLTAAHIERLQGNGGPRRSGLSWRCRIDL